MVLQEKWELKYFCATVKENIHCLMCNNTIGTPKEYSLKKHETNQQSYDKHEGSMCFKNHGNETKFDTSIDMVYENRSRKCCSLDKLQTQ